MRRRRDRWRRGRGWTTPSDGCGAEPGLVALAKRCLAAEQDDRPADAGELAAAVAALRRQAEERARHAELERARGEVQAREQRKRRRLLAFAAGALIVALGCGVGGTTFGLVRAEKARGEEARQREEAERAWREESKQRALAEARRLEAERARDQARQRYRLALDAFNQMVFGVQNRLKDRPGTQELRKDLLTNARKGLRELLREAERQGTPDSTLVAAHLGMGEVEGVLGDTAAALKEYQAGHDLAKRLAEADPKDALAQRDLSVSLNRLGDVALEMGDTRAALGHFQKSLEARQRLAEADPKSALAHVDLFTSYWKLGTAEKKQHDFGKASAWFAKGRAVLLPWHEKKLLAGQAANYLALVDRELALCKNAEKAVARLDFVFEQPADQIGTLLDLRVRALLHQKKLGRAQTTADRFAAWAEEQGEGRDTHRYNAACAYALCAAAAGEKDRAVLVDQALALLGKLRDAGYFKDARQLAHFKQDADFAAVRARAAFAQFVKELEKR